MRTMSHITTGFQRRLAPVRLNSLLVGLLALLLGVSTGGLADEFGDAAPLDDFESYLADSTVDLANFQQPGTARPPSSVRRPSRRPVTGQELAPPTASDTGDYLASAPRMFGHYFGSLGQLRETSFIFDGPPQLVLTTDLPMGGGASPLQISDNNTPLPQNRAYFTYNHYENALRTQSGNRRLFLPVDQYTVGIERTFLDDISSWQLQLPMTGGFDVAGNPGVTAGQIGNLGLVSKTAIWRSDYAILSGGLGLELPTGSSVQGRGEFSRYQIRNSATTVLPFVGIMALPTDDTFFQGFFTASVPASGNQFAVGSPGNPLQDVGVFTPQTRLHLDLAGGVWFHQNPGAGGLTGLAFVGEIHYVAATQRGDIVNAFGRNSFSFYQLGNLTNQQTATNFTVGIHTVWNDRFQFRVGGAFPLAQLPNRGYDGEVLVQLNFIP